MPQMVALFNGVGGGAAALISLAEFHRLAPEPGGAPGRHQHGDRALGDHREHLVLRIDGRVREAAGAHSWAADRLPFSEDGERAALRRRAGRGNRDRCGLRAAVADVGAARRRVALRGPVRAADRRRRHAGRDLAAECLHGPRRRRDRLRAREQRPDRQRDARRRLGNVPHDHDGQGDEPLDRERALRRVRADRSLRGGGRCERKRTARCALRPPTTWR